MTKILLLLSLIATLSGFTCSEDGKDGFLPENELYISEGMKGANAMEESQFNDTISSVETVFAPIVSSLGGKLQVFRKWDDGTVNAYAKRTGNIYEVHMFGGLARHATVTLDALALVMCHEIGHHIGGAPKKGAMWASNEGQSDYWASLKCLRKVWLNEDNKEVICKMSVPTHVTTQCNSIWSKEADQSICVRSSMAGLSVGNMFAALRNGPSPKFDTPDKNVVASTDHNHPATQCRLDTYFNGALCDMDDNTDVDQKDEKIGTCMADAESKKTIGTRPLCWFKSGGTTIGQTPGKWWLDQSVHF